MGSIVSRVPFFPHALFFPLAPLKTGPAEVAVCREGFQCGLQRGLEVAKGMAARREATRGRPAETTHPTNCPPHKYKGNPTLISSFFFITLSLLARILSLVFEGGSAWVGLGWVGMGVGQGRENGGCG